MASPRQKCGGCGHLMAGFDNHSFCSRCRDKRKGNDPCVERPESTNCKFCNTITTDQHNQLSIPSYRIKKEKCEAKNGTVFMPTKDTQVDLAC